MSDENKAVIRRLYNEAISGGDLAVPYMVLGKTAFGIPMYDEDTIRTAKEV